MMPEEQRFSLWVVPEGAVYQRFADLIATLAARAGTPGFEPHVTLLGGIAGAEAEVRRLCEALAELLEPFEVKLADVGMADEHYRALFVAAEPTPELLNAEARARDVFRRAGEPPFLPHLSLLYGDLLAADKEALLEGVGREFQASFRVSALHLYRTGGGPASWRRVLTVPLDAEDSTPLAPRGRRGQR